MVKRKSNSVVTVQRDGNVLMFDVLDAGTVIFDPTKASAPNRAYAEIYGWIQRLSDKAAKPRNPETGKPATAAEKFNSIKALAEYYMTGADGWTLSGAGGTGHSITLEAIARVQGVDYATAQERVAAFAQKKHDGDVKAALAFLRDGKRVQEAIEAIRKERMAAPKVDADEALSELSE